MPRYLCVKGRPGLPVANPWTGGMTYVGTDVRRTRQFAQVIPDHPDLAKSLRNGELEQLDKSQVFDSVEDAVAYWADELEEK